MKNNLSNIKKSKFYLDKGECVAIPTETVYGLAGNAYSDKASLKIFQLKKRTKKNPLIVHYNNLKMLNNDCIITNEFLKLYKKFCPGPLTFVLNLKKRSEISKNVTNNKETLAVRFPSHPLTRKLLKFTIVLQKSVSKFIVFLQKHIKFINFLQENKSETLPL